MEKEDPEYSKHNKKLDDDDDPNLSSPVWHISETIII